MSWRELGNEYYPGVNFSEPSDLYFKAAIDGAYLHDGPLALSTNERQAMMGARATRLLNLSFQEDASAGNRQALKELLSVNKYLKEAEREQ